MKYALPLILAGLAATLPAQADPGPGAAKAYLCTGCHGADGMRSAPGEAGIGGRPAAALVAAMQDYRHLRRLNPAMQLLLLSMTDQDIQEVAEYFAKAGTTETR